MVLGPDKHQRSMGCYFQYLGDIISLYLSVVDVVSDHRLTSVSLSPDTIRRTKMKFRCLLKLYSRRNCIQKDTILYFDA